MHTYQNNRYQPQSNALPRRSKQPLTSWTLAALLAIAGVAAPTAAGAATVWTGPMIPFINAAGSDATQAVNQDRLTPNVWITRGGLQGIYNAKTETAFTHFLSPADTAWADGTTASYSSLSYTNWDAWAKIIHVGPPNTVGVNAVVHLISEDIYLDVQFTSWGGSGGGFSYRRSTPAGTQVPPTVAIVSPTNGAAFTAPANVLITATATAPDGSVTNVGFFAGGTFLGGTNNPPYTIIASLGAGSHALTAVATDNLGLSSSSAVVNVTVSGGNTPPSVTITNPPDNSVFGNTDTVLVGASASDTDGSVTNVQFFDGVVSLGNRATSPYSVSTRLALGAHTLTAVASDNLGATTTSAPVHVTVARYLPAITNGNIAIHLQPIATGMAAPDYAISPPGDTSRLFVVEQNGLLRVIQNGSLLPGSALDIQSRVQPPLVPTNPNDERGFLGLAFHPGFNNPLSPGFQTLYTYNSEQIPA
ncbi:MAG: Ig-like domain-containing protein, partial [Verrucomicrobia bacterium]|nr:Ig-like domain-containing protein [Verrucomicrobiota bacterium]